MAISAKTLTILCIILGTASAAGAAYESKRIADIDAFNNAILHAKGPETAKESFEAKFATAYWLANNERYKEATLLFMQLEEHANSSQKAAIKYNLGNIFFRRGLLINGTNMTVRDETEYLLRQAKTAYVASLKLEPGQWDAKHNLDRVLTMLPATPTPGVGESDSPGLIMGNIPVGLP